MNRLILLFIFLTFKAHCSDLTVQSSSPLGLPTTITDLYIPGAKVEPIPQKNREGSLVIRLLEIKPAADGFRYDLEVYGLDPGTHQLSDYLHYTNGDALPAFDSQIEITTRHPLDSLPPPEALRPNDPDRLGGYRLLIIILGILWLLGFLIILLYRKKLPPPPAPPTPELTLHEKLNRLVSSASKGDLPDNDRAQLERLIIGHWKQKLPNLQNLSPAKALIQLRTHPDASPLILKLEQWLHAPNPELTHKDILPLLDPYQGNSKSQIEKP
jgi:hypothetical protein